MIESWRRTGSGARGADGAHRGEATPPAKKLIMCLNLLVFVLICFIYCVLAADKYEDCYRRPSTPNDRRIDKTKLTIGTFNAEYLFLNDWKGGHFNSSEQAEMHFKNIVDVIRQLNVDVLNMVEVEGCYVLRRIAEELGPTFGYKHYLIRGLDTATGENVGLLTRVDPIDDLQRTDERQTYPMTRKMCKCGDKPLDQTDTAVSKNYYTRIRPKGFPEILLIGVHFMAFPQREDRCWAREAQAAIIQQLIVNERRPEEEVVLMGDFNDFDEDVPDVAESKPIGCVLRQLKDPYSWTRKTYEIGRPDQMLVSVATFIDQPIRYTSYYNKKKECQPAADASTSIDHILISQNLVQGLRAATVEHLYPQPCAVEEKEFSDHWPIKVKLLSPLIDDGGNFDDDDYYTTPHHGTGTGMSTTTKSGPTASEATGEHMMTTQASGGGDDDELSSELKWTVIAAIGIIGVASLLCLGWLIIACMTWRTNVRMAGTRGAGSRSTLLNEPVSETLPLFT